ncbi:hypothetical protein BDV96DRAFT_595887 [Lophiotrema nucula]|uniref:Uncharacterized protein n=1 Tax=Lophiotrema nucula TaxID=690887 RepID=A0A6A5ZPZ7_9PLEO|nr:hypothetical protein BDV96DRAFT_595887 [Lophiotrema nucula]
MSPNLRPARALYGIWYPYSDSPIQDGTVALLEYKDTRSRTSVLRTVPQNNSTAENLNLQLVPTQDAIPSYRSPAQDRVTSTPLSEHARFFLINRRSAIFNRRSIAKHVDRTAKATFGAASCCLSATLRLHSGILQPLHTSHLSDTSTKKSNHNKLSKPK